MGAAHCVAALGVAFALGLYAGRTNMRCAAARVLAAVGVTEACKMVVLLRTDIPAMSQGKGAAQACHAAVDAFRAASRRRPEWVDAWDAGGSKKIVLRIDSEEQVLALVRAARVAGLPSAAIRDAGLTQLAAGTLTAAAIGPAPAAEVDRITGHLRLYA